MADSTISDLTAVTDLQATDDYVLMRSGVTKRITGEDLASEILALAPPASGTDDPIDRQFGTPTTAFEFDTSTSGLTTLGSPDTIDSDTTVPGHLFLRDNDTTTVGAYTTPPSYPFTAIARVKQNIHSTNAGAGVYIAEASPGVLEFIGPFNSPTGGQGTWLIAHIRYSNPTTYGGVSSSYTVGQRDPIYVAIRANSASDIDFLYSFDGHLWNKMVDSRNPSITVGQVGVFQTVADATDTSSAFEFLRIWNSALTMPGVSA